LEFLDALKTASFMVLSRDWKFRTMWFVILRVSYLIFTSASRRGSWKKKLPCPLEFWHPTLQL